MDDNNHDTPTNQDTPKNQNVTMILNATVGLITASAAALVVFDPRHATAFLALSGVATAGIVLLGAIKGAKVIAHVAAAAKVRVAEIAATQPPATVVQAGNAQVSGPATNAGT